MFILITVNSFFYISQKKHALTGIPWYEKRYTFICDQAALDCKRLYIIYVFSTFNRVLIK